MLTRFRGSGAISPQRADGQTSARCTRIEAHGKAGCDDTVNNDKNVVGPVCEFMPHSVDEKNASWVY